MNLKTLVSPLALAAAGSLLLGSAAFAQTTVGDQEISDADLPRVTEHCVALSQADGEGPADPVAEDPDHMAGDPAVNEEAQTEDAAPAEPAADAAEGDTVDLAAITIEDCQAAGLAP